MNVVFCAGLIAISSVVAIILIMFIAWIITAGKDYLDAADLAAAMGILIGAFIMFGSVCITAFIDNPEQFGYTKINYEHMEEITDEGF